MKVKNKQELLLAYIAGDDIEEYDIDTLENDPEFMRSVINYTNDKRMYQLCSENVKNNFEFVKFIVKKFSDDFDFVDEIAKKYLEQDRDSLDNEKRADYIELSIIMSKLAQQKEKESLVFYKLLLAYLLIPLKAAASIVADDLKSGIGFITVLTEFEGRSIVIEECAKDFITTIINENEIDFEVLLHKRFHNAEEVKKYGITTYLIHFISSYDQDLGSYVAVHLNIIGNLKRKIANILNNWDTFSQTNEYRKFQIIKEKVYRYYDENNVCFGLLSDYEFLCFIAKDLGILDKIEKYFDEEERELEEDIFTIKVSNKLRSSDELEKQRRIEAEIDEITRLVKQQEKERLIRREFTFDEIIHYEAIKKIILSILHQKVVEEPDDYSTSGGTAKIIQFRVNKDYA